MGEIIGIWSPYHRTGRTTISIALTFKILERLAPDKKLLICCTNGNKGTLLKLAGIRPDEIGLDDLVSYKQAGFTLGEYSTILPKRGRLCFAGSNKMTPYFAKTHRMYYERLIDDLQTQFDFILIDLPDGNDNLLGSIFKDKCSKIITVIDQDKERNDEAKASVNGNKENIIVINKYRDIYPSRSEIKGLYSLKGDIFCVPDCSILREMINKGKVSQYSALETDFNIEMDNIVTNLLGTDSLLYINEKSSITSTRKLISWLKTSMLGGEHG